VGCVEEIAGEDWVEEVDEIDEEEGSLRQKFFYVSLEKARIIYSITTYLKSLSR
jgi:hypothetical protein